MARFVTPNVDRIELTDDDGQFWIDVKHELTIGEVKSIQLSPLKALQAGDGETPMKYDIDLDRAVFNKILVWLADWSFVDAKGNKIKPTAAALRSLSEKTYGLIEQTVDDHAADQVKEKHVQSVEERLKRISA